MNLSTLAIAYSYSHQGEVAVKSFTIALRRRSECTPIGDALTQMLKSYMEHTEVPVTKTLQSKAVEAAGLLKEIDDLIALSSSMEPFGGEDAFN